MEPSPGLEPAMNAPTGFVYRKNVLSIDRGTRYSYGTDWPVSNKIDRFCRPGERPVWIAIKGLCNGVSDSSSDFKTLKDAKAWLGV